MKTDKQKVSDSDFEKPISDDIEKDVALNKLTSLDKSRSSSKTETEDTVTLDTKNISISSASSDDKNIKEQQPTEIRFIKNKLISDNWGLSSMSIHGESITTLSPDGERIPGKKNKKKLLEISITGNKITQEPDNQS